MLLPHMHSAGAHGESIPSGHVGQWVPAGGGRLPDLVKYRCQLSSLGYCLLFSWSTEECFWHINCWPGWQMCDMG